MFRVEGFPRFFERKWVRYGFTLAWFSATLLALYVLFALTRKRLSAGEGALLALTFILLAGTGAVLFLVYRAYAQTLSRLAYVKLYAFDILQSLSIGVLTSDLAGTITNINERARALAGLHAGEVRKPFREILGHVPALAGALDRLLGQGGPFTGVDVEQELAGKVLTLRLDGRFLLSTTGERIGALLQIQDVSHLKFLDQEMRRTEKLAGLGTLAAGIAHEIRNPLAALSINAQLLEEAVTSEKSPAKSAKYLGIIQAEIRRLQSIVEKYISFARPRTLEKSATTFEGILESILALVEPECRKRKIAIVRQGFDESPARHLIDEGQIQQALLNVAINAIQAMEKGGTLTCRLGRSGAYVTVEIEDTGPGIPPDVRERLFDLFFTTRQGGTGLGLYLTQRIVSEHKGYINLKTSPQGTTFVIGIPVEIPACPSKE